MVPVDSIQWYLCLIAIVGWGTGKHFRLTGWVGTYGDNSVLYIVIFSGEKPSPNPTLLPCSYHNTLISGGKNTRVLGFCKTKHVFEEHIAESSNLNQIDWQEIKTDKGLSVLEGWPTHLQNKHRAHSGTTTIIRAWVWSQHWWGHNKPEQVPNTPPPYKSTKPWSLDPRLMTWPLVHHL